MDFSAIDKYKNIPKHWKDMIVGCLGGTHSEDVPSVNSTYMIYQNVCFISSSHQLIRDLRDPSTPMLKSSFEKITTIQGFGSGCVDIKIGNFLISGLANKEAIRYVKFFSEIMSGKFKDTIIEIPLIVNLSSAILFIEAIQGFNLHDADCGIMYELFVLYDYVCETFKKFSFTDNKPTKIVADKKLISRFIAKYDLCEFSEIIRKKFRHPVITEVLYKANELDIVEIHFKYIPNINQPSQTMQGLSNFHPPNMQGHQAHGVQSLSEIQKTINVLSNFSQIPSLSRAPTFHRPDEK